MRFVVGATGVSRISAGGLAPVDLPKGVAILPSESSRSLLAVARRRRIPLLRVFSHGPGLVARPFPGITEAKFAAISDCGGALAFSDGSGYVKVGDCIGRQLGQIVTGFTEVLGLNILGNCIIVLGIADYPRIGMWRIKDCLEGPTPPRMNVPTIGCSKLLTGVSSVEDDYIVAVADGGVVVFKPSVNYAMFHRTEKLTTAAFDNRKRHLYCHSNERTVRFEKLKLILEGTASPELVECEGALISMVIIDGQIEAVTEDGRIINCHHGIEAPSQIFEYRGGGDPFDVALRETAAAGLRAPRLRCDRSELARRLLAEGQTARAQIELGRNRRRVEDLMDAVGLAFEGTAAVEQGAQPHEPPVEHQSVVSQIVAEVRRGRPNEAGPSLRELLIHQMEAERNFVPKLVGESSYGVRMARHNWPRNEDEPSVYIEAETWAS